LFLADVKGIGSVLRPDAFVRSAGRLFPSIGCFRPCLVVNAQEVKADQLFLLYFKIATLEQGLPSRPECLADAP
jgi:hypothetical protein